ncbi:conserved hypothetical protein [Talaromyces stipitatus ATCC 10500]|uniref:Restriction of telomere capping protein 5 n=1 Tax=Talaromyces stipitatus (strain ATCC 10500 / CBS 375.48 / QM 6759 / NRRL 1006) TaxID=441959 RepID=RTC5_TALSN|nr:uncharacterized protein TSTA_046520 [Talaromyces stipitatus ATCC 10500]B8MJJ8.1 RecName: Full=Restriction of telomere capping protein 5 [Talaromyces stipitatus ATCC 10500]EED15198.1 conserved hypothetical protein [Talaromyces stipitatus ATCC 10500]
MGASQSTSGIEGASSPEQLSVLLAERFATKCFTPLELTHFKDNFYSRALDQAGFRYWNEKILSDFLSVPDGIYTNEKDGGHDGRLDAGPVVFRMVSYLGAFPFQKTLAPSVLTFDSMVKVVVLLTERYGKVLRRGRKDRVKLLFGSLADVGRSLEQDTKKQNDSAESASKSEDSKQSSHVHGFSVDEPTNDDYEEHEDDDDLALAALESLDAIEVFKHDQQIDRAVCEARISIDTFRRLLMLLLAIAPLRPLESVNKYTFNLSSEEQAAVKREADTIIASFTEEEIRDGIGYKTFAKTVTLSLPHLFDPLTPLFEHLLFSENLDLSRKQTGQSEPSPESPPSEAPTDANIDEKPTTIMLPGSFESAILTPSMVSHLSFFLPASSGQNLYRSDIRLHPVFSTVAHGESLTSFQHNVFTWQAPSLLIVQGALPGSSGSPDELITLGAYIPQPWKPSSSSSYESPQNLNNRSRLPYLFQLHPKHSVLPGNSSLLQTKEQPSTTPIVYFSTTTGIAIGCEVPASAQQHRTSYGPGVPSPHQQPHRRQSSTNHKQQQGPLPHGAGSLIIDAALETAQLHISYLAAHTGVFTPAVPPTLPTITHIDIYNLEIWGIIEPPSLSLLPDSAGIAKDAISRQREAWQFDAREAERRKGINVKLGSGNDSNYQNAKALLEMAGIIGDQAQQRSGGSV